MRTQRSNGTKTYNYVYSGSQLMQMTVGNDTLYFTYGILGPNTVTWNGVTYYYTVNAQGDVTGILDGDGNLVVFYYWDNGWGYNPISDGPLASTLGTLNPLRYRGYVYDQETGLYYLQSRYYDPEIGRFINADILVTTGQGLLGNNMFAYCGNNPVSRKDDGGEFWHIVVGAVIGAVVNGALIVAGNLLDDDPETDWNDGLGLAMVTGAITGGFAVTGCGPAVQMAVNAAATAVEGLPDVVQDIQNGENVLTTLGEYALEIGISAVTSYSPGLGSKAVTNLGKQTVKRTINALAHDGFQAGVKELGAAAKWYWKSAKTYIRNISWEYTKGLLNDFADNMIRDLVF